MTPSGLTCYLPLTSWCLHTDLALCAMDDSLHVGCRQCWWANPCRASDELKLCRSVSVLDIHHCWEYVTVCYLCQCYTQISQLLQKQDFFAKLGNYVQLCCLLTLKSLLYMLNIFSDCTGFKILGITSVESVY